MLHWFAAQCRAVGWHGLAEGNPLFLNLAPLAKRRSCSHNQWSMYVTGAPSAPVPAHGCITLRLNCPCFPCGLFWILPESSIAVLCYRGSVLAARALGWGHPYIKNAPANTGFYNCAELLLQPVCIENPIRNLEHVSVQTKQQVHRSFFGWKDVFAPSSHSHLQTLGVLWNSFICCWVGASSTANRPLNVRFSPPAAPVCCGTFVQVHRKCSALEKRIVVL